MNDQLIEAAKSAPAVCYALRPNGRFCTRPKGWAGHHHKTYECDHDYVSLEDLMRQAAAQRAQLLEYFHADADAMARLPDLVPGWADTESAQRHERTRKLLNP